jgi:hypothetical protein
MDEIKLIQMTLAAIYLANMEDDDETNIDQTYTCQYCEKMILFSSPLRHGMRAMCMEEPCIKAHKDKYINYF